MSGSPPTPDVADPRRIRGLMTQADIQPLWTGSPTNRNLLPEARPHCRREGPGQGCRGAKAGARVEVKMTSELQNLAAAQRAILRAEFGVPDEGLDIP